MPRSVNIAAPQPHPAPRWIDSGGRPIYRCPQGEVLNMNSPTPCNATGRCYNDILTSEYLGYYAHYVCQDKCITGDDLCQGVSFCDGDEEECGPKLRCPESSTRHKSTHTSRYYCYDNDDYKKIKNNGSMTWLTGRMETSPSPPLSPLVRTLTTRLWPLALLSMGRVLCVMSVSTVPAGVMITVKNIVKTPVSAQLTQSYAQTTHGKILAVIWHLVKPILERDVRVQLNIVTFHLGHRAKSTPQPAVTIQTRCLKWESNV